MSTLKVTKKTSDQITTDFAVAFKEIKPIPATPVTQADRLEPYRKEIMKQRRRGLTWQQIAMGMAHPAVNEKVSSRLLMRLFGVRESTPQAEYKPAADRLVLDPLTGQPVPAKRF
jgi:hypothetical protein